MERRAGKRKGSGCREDFVVVMGDTLNVLMSEDVTVVMGIVLNAFTTRKEAEAVESFFRKRGYEVCIALEREI